MSLCSTDIFLPTPDSLLVNLNECKEVGVLFLGLVYGLMNRKSGRTLEESSFCHFSM